jgi:pimeloyl-ACP methyl ester carboxylesterase
LTNADSEFFRPAEFWAEIGGLNVRYLDWGGDGPPIMALHGLASSANWYDIVAQLLRKHGRIIAPDQRGHGQTTQAPTGYDWQTLSSDIVGLMDHLGIDKATVLGHSWGGNVAGNLAARFPERVEKLVLIDGGFSGRRQQPGVTWESFRERARPRDVTGTREEFLDRLRVQLAECWSDELERIVQTMVYEDEEGQIKDILRPDNHAQVMKAMWDEPPSTTLPNVVCPALLVPAGPRPERANSEFAKMREENVELASKVIANCQVHWIPDTMHDIGYHKPVELAEVIGKFLTEK